MISLPLKLNALQIYKLGDIVRRSQQIKCVLSSIINKKEGCLAKRQPSNSMYSIH